LRPAKPWKQHGRGGKSMNTSEFGNISWVFYVVAAYGAVAASIVLFAISTRRQYCNAQEALKEEGFSSDKTW
jgi:hypothetical protein